MATIQKFISALDECEFERYAPGDAKGNMHKTFEAAMTAITEIENVVNALHKNASAKAGVMILLLMLLPLSASAVTKSNGDAEYRKGNYSQAIADYEELLKQGVSADLYYNLGNAYYRNDNITRAVLSYERAHLLRPGDRDIRHNLELARSKTIDKIGVDSESMITTSYRAVVNLMSVDGWGMTSLLSILFLIVASLVFLFSDKMLWRRLGLSTAIVFLVVFICSMFFAFEQQSALLDRKGAIVTTSSVSVKRTPATSAEDVFVIHEGTRVDIEDKTMQGWRQIRLADGREGWVQTRQIEEI